MCCQVDQIFEQKMPTNVEQANMSKYHTWEETHKET